MANETIVFAVEALIAAAFVIGFMYEEKIARFERKLFKKVKKICRKWF